MKRVVLLVGIIVTFAFGASNAWSTCASEASGTYAGYAFGTTTGSYLSNSVSALYLDGNGNFNSSRWMMQSGVYQSGTSNGIYSVNTYSDGQCYGTLSPTGGTANTFFIADGGATLYELNQTSGTNITMVWTKQSLTGCSNSILSGKYGAYAWGTNPGNHLDNSVLAWSFNGSGNYLQSWWNMQSGSYQSGTQSGTYSTSVDSNTGACVGTYTPSGQSSQPMVIAQGGSVFYALNEVSGANNSQVAMKQVVANCGSAYFGTPFGGYTYGVNPGSHLDNAANDMAFGTESVPESWWGMQAGNPQSGTTTEYYGLSTDSYTGACVGYISSSSSSNINTVMAGANEYLYQVDPTSGANNTHVWGNQANLTQQYGCSASTLAGKSFSGYSWGHYSTAGGTYLINSIEQVTFSPSILDTGFAMANGTSETYSGPLNGNTWSVAAGPNDNGCVLTFTSDDIVTATLSSDANGHIHIYGYEYESAGGSYPGPDISFVYESQ